MKCPAAHDLVASLEGADGWLPRLAAERHIRYCPSCRDRLAGLAGSEEVIRRYFEVKASTQEAGCPSWEDLVALMEDDLAEADRPRVAEHVENCCACSRSVSRLRSWSKGSGETYPRPSEKLGVEATTALVPAPARRWRLVAYPVAVGLAVSAVLLMVPRKQPDTMTLLGPPGARVSDPGPEVQSASPGVSAVAGVVGVRESPSVLVAFRYRLHGSTEIREVWPPFHGIPSLSPEDDYALRVRPSRDGWLYIFQIDSRGRLAQLFPSARYGTAQNPVKAGIEYSAPADQLWYYLDRTEGTETIYVAFSASKRDQWEDLARRSEERGDPLAARKLVAQLEELASTVGPQTESRDTSVVLHFAHVRERSH